MLEKQSGEITKENYEVLKKLLEDTEYADLINKFWK